MNIDEEQHCVDIESLDNAIKGKQYRAEHYYKKYVEAGGFDWRTNIAPITVPARVYYTAQGYPIYPVSGWFRSGPIGVNTQIPVNHGIIKEKDLDEEPIKQKNWFGKILDKRKNKK